MISSHWTLSSALDMSSVSCSRTVIHSYKPTLTADIKYSQTPQRAFWHWAHASKVTVAATEKPSPSASILKWVLGWGGSCSWRPAEVELQLQG